MVDQYSTESEDGSEIHLRNGSIVRVKESIQEVNSLMTGMALSFYSHIKEKQNSVASEESSQKRA
jgi:hypothetical protein